jgi:hypothetical protein
MQHRLACARLWRAVRRPFALPYRLAGHDCTQHWEAVDIDVAGCLVCGRVHFCTETGEDKLRPRFANRSQKQRIENMDCSCDPEHCDGHTVCRITGYCVREKVFAENEFMDTAAPPRAAPPPVVPAVETADTLAQVEHVLCSPASRKCLAHENVRLQARATHALQRILRECKARGEQPNACRVAAALAHRMQGARMCAPAFDEAQRRRLAEACATCITRLLRSLLHVCPTLLAHTRREAVVVGLLYLMRTGLLVHNTFVLPRVAALQQLLPLESHLMPYFAVRCKSITETENMLKMLVRRLSTEQIAMLGLNVRV